MQKEPRSVLDVHTLIIVIGFLGEPLIIGYTYDTCLPKNLSYHTPIQNTRKEPIWVYEVVLRTRFLLNFIVIMFKKNIKWMIYLEKAQSCNPD